MGGLDVAVIHLIEAIKNETTKVTQHKAVQKEKYNLGKDKLTLLGRALYQHLETLCPGINQISLVQLKNQMMIFLHDQFRACDW